MGAKLNVSGVAPKTLTEPTESAASSDPKWILSFCE